LDSGGRVPEGREIRGISIGKDERHDNMTYSPPSNKIQRFGPVQSVLARAVEVIVELLAMIDQRGLCLHIRLVDRRVHPSHAICDRACGRVHLSGGDGASGRLR
jgi:hypothetical protein